MQIFIVMRPSVPTRTLRERPHLDQLKRQAKELHDAFVRGDAAAVSEVAAHYRDADAAAFFAPGKYYMTDQQDPSQKTEMQARFLLGEEPPPGLKPDQRRVAGAAYLIYNPDNYWFARAYVNRIWSELIGDGFYSVDSLGPDKDVVYKLVVNRLGASFRSSGFDVRWLFRTIMASQAYQRETRTLENDADLFTATRGRGGTRSPTRTVHAGLPKLDIAPW